MGHYNSIELIRYQAGKGKAPYLYKWESLCSYTSLSTERALLLERSIPPNIVMRAAE